MLLRYDWFQFRNNPSGILGENHLQRWKARSVFGNIWFLAEKCEQPSQEKNLVCFKFSNTRSLYNVYLNSFSLFHSASAFTTNIGGWYFRIWSGIASGAKFQIIFANRRREMVFMGGQTANISGGSNNYKLRYHLKYLQRQVEILNWYYLSQKEHLDVERYGCKLYQWDRRSCGLLRRSYRKCIDLSS